MSNSSTKGISLVPRPTQAWIAILGLTLFLALCLLSGAGRILILAFPLGSLAVGVFLYQRYPILYVGFTWWMWFLGPLVRRLIDYQSGYLTPGPWNLTPLLVTSISSATLIRHFPKSFKQDGFPFILCFGSVIYGFLVGLIQNTITDTVIVNLLSWLTPILFGFHLYINWRDYPRYCLIIQRTFLWGVLVMGAYGVCQYLLAPEWERFWLRNIDTISFGKPEPLGIRVLSTMDSPQSFANVMMAGLLLLFSNQGNLRFPAAGVGYLTFLLSLARSAWLGWLAGLLIFIPSLKARLQMRLAVSIVVLALFIVPLVTVEPFSTVISTRFDSLSNPETDTSYQARSEGYNELLGLALAEPLGQGLSGVVTGSSIGTNDSGILSIFFSLGWFGTIPYLSGLGLLFFKLFRGERNFDTFASAASAIVIGVFVQIGFNVVMTGSLGMVLWGFLGAGLAAHRFYLYQCTTKFKEGKDYQFEQEKHNF